MVTIIFLLIASIVAAVKIKPIKTRQYIVAALWLAVIVLSIIHLQNY